MQNQIIHIYNQFSCSILYFPYDTYCLRVLMKFGLYHQRPPMDINFALKLGGGVNGRRMGRRGERKVAHIFLGCFLEMLGTEKTKPREVSSPPAP